MYSIFVYPSHDDEITRGVHLTLVKNKTHLIQSQCEGPYNVKTNLFDKI